MALTAAQRTELENLIRNTLPGHEIPIPDELQKAIDADIAERAAKLGASAEVVNNILHRRL